MSRKKAPVLVEVAGFYTVGGCKGCEHPPGTNSSYCLACKKATMSIDESLPNSQKYRNPGVEPVIKDSQTKIEVFL